MRHQSVWPLQKIASLTMLDECAKSLPRKCAAALTVTLSTLTFEGKEALVIWNLGSSVNCNRRVENPNKTFSSVLISNGRARPSRKLFVVFLDLDGFCDPHWLFPLSSTSLSWISAEYKQCLLLKFHIFHRLRTWNDKTDNWHFEVSSVRLFDANSKFDLRLSQTWQILQDWFPFYLSYLKYSKNNNFLRILKI